MHLTSAVEDPAPLDVGTDDEPAELGEVLGFLAAELGLPEPGVEENDAGLAPGRGGDRRLSNARLRGTGFERAYPTYREGYRAMLDGHGVRHP
jgi:hypothetical protein